MRRAGRCFIALSALWIAGCANDFVSSWAAPDAQPLALRGHKVAAVAMMADGSSRRMVEDILAQEITNRGAIGVPMYTLLPDATPTNEPSNRGALAAAGVKAAVVMRPVSVDKQIVSSPINYADGPYNGYWGAYYEYGWSSPWSMPTGGEMSVDVIVEVETTVYSLEQNKLVWAGQSKTTNPEGIDRLVRQLANATARELEKRDLIGH